MGCVSVRQGKTLRDIKLDFTTDLEKKFNEACILIYDHESPVQTTPISKSHIQLLPNGMNPWIGISQSHEIGINNITQKPVRLYLKMENFQQTGSFKLRGAFYKITKLYKKQVQSYMKNRLRVVIASTGNHAIACAHVANFYNKQQNVINTSNDGVNAIQNLENLTELNQVDQNQNLNDDKPNSEKIELTIFVSSSCSKSKLEKLKDCHIKIAGDDCLHSENQARTYANEQLCDYISPYNDPDIIAAAATIGLEIQSFFNQKLSVVDYVFVSVGGGGLISGIAFYLKYIKKMNTKIIGIQPEGNTCMYDSIKKGKIDNSNQLQPTLSDGTDGGLEEGSCTFEICQKLVDDWIIVDEQEIINGMKQLAQDEKVIVEGSAALAYAGSLKYMSLHKLTGENSEINCVVVLCGQNIALDIHRKIVQQDTDD